MKYEVTFSCGHTGTVQLYGKGDERERKIRYFEEYGVCSECYKERRAIEAEIGCKHVTMFYRTYKTDYSFCDVLNDSYDKQEKTITVLVPEALVDFIDAKNEGGATLFRVSEQKVRKVLIDAGAYESDMSIQVNDLYEQGYSVENIAEKLRVSKSTVSAYLPYTKGVYLGENPSSNALKIRKCRAKNG